MKPFKIILLTLAVFSLFTACKKTPIVILEDETYFGDLCVATTESSLQRQRIQVFVEINDDNTLNFTMKEVKFDEEMSTIDMKITSIIYKKVGDIFTLSVSKEGIIPTDMIGTPFPQYTIKELEGTITSEELWFFMYCGENRVDFRGVLKGMIL